MHKLLFTASLLCAAPAMSAVTITALPAGPFVENHSDLFDVSNGTTAYGGSGGYPTFFAEDAIGDSHASSLEPGHFVFNDFLYAYQTQSISFKTTSAVAVSGFNLFLGSDNAGAREFDSFELLGSLDNVTFTSLVSGTIAGPTYLAAYGSTGIQVQATFAAANYQYFRLNAHDRSGFLGGRILEFDAIAGTVAPPVPPVPGAVPEPATWAMMLFGFGLVGATLRRRERLAHATLS